MMEPRGFSSGGTARVAGGGAPIIAPPHGRISYLGRDPEGLQGHGARDMEREA
jgi:hypothetical protein